MKFSSNVIISSDNKPKKTLTNMHDLQHRGMLKKQKKSNQPNMCNLPCHWVCVKCSVDMCTQLVAIDIVYVLCTCVNKFTLNHKTIWSWRDVRKPGWSERDGKLKRWTFIDRFDETSISFITFASFNIHSHTKTHIHNWCVYMWNRVDDVVDSIKSNMNIWIDK